MNKVSKIPESILLSLALGQTAFATLPEGLDCQVLGGNGQEKNYKMSFNAIDQLPEPLSGSVAIDVILAGGSESFHGGEVIQEGKKLKIKYTPQDEHNRDIGPSRYMYLTDIGENHPGIWEGNIYNEANLECTELGRVEVNLYSNGERHNNIGDFQVELYAWNIDGGEPEQAWFGGENGSTANFLLPVDTDFDIQVPNSKPCAGEIPFVTTERGRQSYNLNLACPFQAE